MELNERSRKVLNAVVLSYIERASPVGSQTVTKKFSFGLSPATIRNIMAELEEMGYLLQPHTSAGRIPTSKGYRLYVDELMEEEQPSIFDEDFLEGTYLGLKREDPHALLQETTRMLSLLSHYAGIVLAPKVSKARLDRLEFILVRKGHALIVQVSKDGLVQHRMIDVDPELTQKDLTRISAFLNEKFSGLSLDEIRRRLVKEMEAEKELYNRLLQKASELGQKALAEQPEEELYVVGTSNILNLPEFTENLEKMKALFKTFEEKAVILKLLNHCLETEGVQIFIGSESSVPGIEDFSLVVASYRGGDDIGGTLGVIGPTRMEYSRVIPLVDHTAKLLSRLLDQD
ncbi:MAG: heat-inducible transcription repressor HrcA [Nitrospirae bacterium]|nr:heat-inducible transcription repressor HrcA [Nitrospirota bacterium]